MNRSERESSLARHHAVVERETEALRKYCSLLEDRLQQIKKLIPSLDVEIGMEKPAQTDSWAPDTYRDPITGQFPGDIREHNDWLKEEDYRNVYQDLARRSNT